jgi:serine/threonine-protein kinase
MILGTPYFMAPEQFKSNMEIDHRVDIYALGVTFYCMLTGKHPFQGKTPYQIMNAHLNEKYRPISELNPEVPEELAAIIDRMLQKDRARRYQSLQEFMGDLGRVRLPRTSDSES